MSTLPKIKIMKDGPYWVTGNVPLMEYIINDGPEGLEYIPGRTFPAMQSYALCRCGKSTNMPFCDAVHQFIHFDGTETADKTPYLERSDLEVIENGDLRLTDAAGLCVLARFCHAPIGDVWDLAELPDAPEDIQEATIRAACDCPAGRLVMWNVKTGEAYEPKFEPSIVLLEDPDCDCSGPIWVRGGIRIESSDCDTYEVRNRVTLCRCGASQNKPFCDGAHMDTGATDDED